jgi:hypothetical protein
LTDIATPKFLSRLPDCFGGEPGLAAAAAGVVIPM